MPSQEEILREIESHFGYPLLAPYVTVCGERDTEAFRGMQELVARGYLVPNAQRVFRYEPEWIPADAAKAYVRRGPTFHILLQDYCIQVHVCKVVLKRIVDIKPDGEDGSLLVTFETGLEPVEPYYSLLCRESIPGCRAFAGARVHETARKTARLKKVGGNWRIAR